MNKRTLFPIITLLALSACSSGEPTLIPEVPKVELDNEAFPIDINFANDTIQYNGVTYSQAQYFESFGSLYAYPTETDPDIDPRTFQNSFRTVTEEITITTTNGDIVTLVPGDLMSTSKVGTTGTGDPEVYPDGFVFVKFDEVNDTYYVVISNRVFPEN